MCYTSYSPSKVYLKLVKNRSADILMPILDSVCRPGQLYCLICGHLFRGLVNLTLYLYDSLPLINFVDPETFAHSQNIESFWSENKVKKLVK
jgi:hypothetical protein